MPDISNQVNFIHQCALLALIIWAWKQGEGWRHLAAVMLLASGVDALIDLPEFISENNWPAAAAEVCWLFAAVAVGIYYISEYKNYKLWQQD